MPLYACTVLLSAFLLFLVQPIMAKLILPWFGGSAAVWIVCLVFFQTLLLLGYLYAHGITRLLRPREICLGGVIGGLQVPLHLFEQMAGRGWRHGRGEPPRSGRMVGRSETGRKQRSRKAGQITPNKSHRVAQHPVNA